MAKIKFTPQQDKIWTHAFESYLHSHGDTHRNEIQADKYAMEEVLKAFPALREEFVFIVEGKTQGGRPKHTTLRYFGRPMLWETAEGAQQWAEKFGFVGEPRHASAKEKREGTKRGSVDGKKSSKR